MVWLLKKDKITKKIKDILYIVTDHHVFDAQRLNCLSFVDEMGFTCFPVRITPIFKFFNRNQKPMIVGMVTGKKVF